MGGDQVSITRLIRQVRGDIDTPHSLFIACDACHLELKTNSPELIEHLKVYFASFLSEGCDPDIRIVALEMTPPDLRIDFIDWPRDPGKVGGKDSYADLIDGRACRKVRTAMQYLLGDGERIIFGECLKNDNQVINFIVSQHIGWLMNQGAALCHASGVAVGDNGLAIAAFSGGGKSTLALHLVRQGLDFISNDRTLIALNDRTTVMYGVAKHPRINPGTVLNNPALGDIIPEQRQLELAKLPTGEIWDLEEKYDALVDQIFGPGRFRLSASLSGFLILNWKRNSNLATKIEPAQLSERPDLLEAIMKPPGPFYIPDDVQGPRGFIGVNASDYLPILETIPVFEATGVTDFDFACAFCRDILD